MCKFFRTFAAWKIKWKKNSSELRRGWVSLNTILFSSLTIVALLLWQILFHADQSTASLKWLQFLQTAGTFLLPPVLCALIWDPNRRPLAWLKMDRTVPWWYYLAGVLIMVAALPAINLIADLNGRVQLPESLDSIEQFLKQQEEAAAALTERFLQADNFGVLLINIALMALLPAIAEELSFRGTLQQILGNKHIAIWVTAIIFSAIHMQFYGFIPRMLIGALLGFMSGPVASGYPSSCILPTMAWRFWPFTSLTNIR